ncbi:Lrp/AsnC family transcriptional regulator [Novosphingobium sp. YAF33]|uniref:Lrp/AsnC family transcriptional regulator n=1 Tax=Novosphingobium sp. YAF33 TaxID=3233082 RepID=UPI003F94611C
MDDFDRKILSALQVDGRLTLTDLAERVGLSLSPCHRRVRALEESGVISSYRAELDAGMLGLNFSAIVFATLLTSDRGTLEAFESSLVEVPHIVQAQRLFGDPDYMLHVVSRDLPAFQRLYDERLSTLPGVQKLSSTLVMKDVVSHRPLPL